MARYSGCTVMRISEAWYTGSPPSRMASMFRPFIANWRKVVFDPLAWYLSKRELRALMRAEQDLDSVVKATEQCVGRGFYASIRPVQNRSEITKLAAIVRREAPRVVVEIGTYKGGTLCIWCRSNPHAELIVSIDLPEGPYGGGCDSRRDKLYKHFLFDNPRARMALMRRDSHAEATLAELESVLGSRAVDFLYIDGDHTYEGAKKDFEMYSPLVTKGGIVAFHDIVTRSQECGVWKLWNQLRQEHKHVEFVDLSDNKGIGLLYL